MTTRAYLTTKGLSEYLEKVQQAGVDIDAAAQRALMKGGVVLEAGMEALVPVDKGNLKAHVNIDGPFQDGNYNFIEVGVVNADAETAIIGNVQEYGSPSKNIPAQSYIRAGVDQKKSAVLREFRASLKAEGLAD